MGTMLTLWAVTLLVALAPRFTPFFLMWRTRGLGLKIQFTKRGYIATGMLHGHPVTMVGTRVKLRFDNSDISFMPTRLQRGGSRYLSGDPALDRLTVLYGDEAHLMAVLTPEVRQRLVETLNRHMSIVDGVLEFTYARGPEAIARYAELATWLKRPADVAAALIHNAQHDPLPSVRERCAEILVSLSEDQGRRVRTE